jgi:ABC-type transport system involved in multi-copper enzyme maturation permease subunit
VTLYARGYRRYDGAREATRLRFLPIQRDGSRTARRGWAFWILNGLGLVMLVILAVMVYLGTALIDRADARALRNMGFPEEQLAAETLRNAIQILQMVTTGLAQILVLFVGAGLIADDLRARALALYLVRPITPFDYYLGKLLIPIRVLGLTVLVPALALVLIAALFRPSDRMLPFLWDQRGVVGAVVVHFAVMALSFASLTLLVSTWTGRRVAAIVLGAVIFFGGSIPRLVAHLTSGPVADVLDATDLWSNAYALFLDLLPTTSMSEALAHMGADGPGSAAERMPKLGPAMAVSGLVVLLAAWTVLRRARTVEVVA